MNFNIRQLKVINAEEPKILCLSSAASGKTRVLTERVRVLIEEKGVPAKESQRLLLPILQQMK